MALSEACPGLSQGSPHHQLPIGMKNNAHWPPSPGAGQQLHEQNYHSKNVPILSDLTADGASAQVPDPPSPHRTLTFLVHSIALRPPFLSMASSAETLSRVSSHLI